MARDKFTLKIDEDMLQVLEKLGGLGLNPEQIRNYFGVTERIWQKYIEKHPEIEIIRTRGLANKISRLAKRCGIKSKREI